MVLGCLLVAFVLEVLYCQISEISVICKLGPRHQSDVTGSSLDRSNESLHFSVAKCFPDLHGWFQLLPDKSPQV